jgi:tetratricopeptide (TPR) repeat protein
MPISIYRPAAKLLCVLFFLGAAVLSLKLADRRPNLADLWRFASQRERRDLNALEEGRLFLESGEPPRAIRAVSTILAGNLHEAEALTIRGVALAQLEELGPARQTLERAWQIRPSGDAARVLAAIYLSANENERGLQMLLEASRLDPADFRPWYAMGESVYLRLRRYDLAIQAFRESLKRDPGHSESRIGLVDALLRSHRIEECAPVLDHVLKEQPENPRVLALAAEFAIESGDEEAARRHLAHALALDRDHRQALVLHARLLFRQGRRQEALTSAERACSLEPNDVPTLTLLSSIQSSLGLKQEAQETLALKREVEERSARMEQLSREILQNPHAPEPRWRLGQLAAQANMKPLAIQSFQAALAQAPDFEPAQKALLELGFPAARLPPSSRNRPRNTSP